MNEICECDCHIIYKLIQRRLTADWLVPRESDCSRTNSKVSNEMQKLILDNLLLINQSINHLN